MLRSQPKDKSAFVHKQTLITILLLGFLISSLSSIFGHTDPVSISNLDQLLSTVAQHNGDYQAAKAATHEAEQNYLSTYSTYLPTLKATSSFTDDFKSQSNRTGLGLALSQRLSPGLFYYPEVQSAQWTWESQKWTLVEEAALIRYNLIATLADWIYYQQTITLDTNIAKRRQKNAKLLQARYAAGREHKGSALRAEAQFKQAIFDLETAKRDLEITEAKLNALTATPVSINMISHKDERSTSNLPTFSPELVQQTSTVKQAEIALKSAGAALDIQNQERFPQIVANLGLDKTWIQSTPQDLSWIGNVTLSLRLFDGNHIHHASLAAASEVDRQKFLLSQTILDQTYTLKVLLSAATEAFEAIDVQEAFTDSAEVRSEIANAQYESGLLTFDDWDIIESDLVSQQKAILTCMRTAMLAEAKLNQFLGKGLD